MQAGLKFNIQTLGCKLNFSESSGIARQLIDAGYARVSEGEPFNVLILNTCSVTENADKKCRAIIRKAQKENERLFTAVIGCYAQLKPEEISKIEGVNLVLGASEKFNIVKHIEENFTSKSARIEGGHIKEVKEFIPSYSLGDRTRSFLKVQDGCDYFCSFCTIPLARGRSRSPEINIIVQQTKEIAKAGINEVVLTGVNIGDFGAGKDENFFDLIKELEKVKGIRRFRISSIEPNLLSDEIIDLVASSSTFMPHFHIPLQSGSDILLKSMRRRYNSELFRKRVERIKQQIPHACIGADVITGYPGETEELFNESVDFIKSLDLSYLHVFTYSERANTVAPRKDGVIPVEIRRQRSRKLQEISRKLKRSFYDKYLNETMEVLFEKEEDGFISGFTPNYIRVKVKSENINENSLHFVKLNRVNSDDEVFSEKVEVLIESPV